MAKKIIKKTPTKKIVVTNKNKNNHKALKVAVGAAGVAAVAGTAAYLFTGKQGKKTKAAISKGAKKIEKKVVTQAKEAKKTISKAYGKVSEAAGKQYNKLSKMEADEIVEFTGDLKKRWDKIAKEIRTVTKTTAKQIKPVKKAITKTVSNAVRPTKKTAPKKRK